MIRARLALAALAVAVIVAAPAAASAAVQPPPTIPVGSLPIEIVLSPDGTEAFTADRVSSTVSVIDVATRAVTRTITGVGVPAGLAVADDGTLYVTQEDVAEVSVVAPGATTPERTFPLPQWAQAISLAPDGTTAWVTVNGPTQDTQGVAHISLADGTVLLDFLGAETGYATDVVVGANGTAYYSFDNLNTLAFVTDGTPAIYDESDPLTTVQNGLAVVGDTAYVSAGGAGGTGTLTQVDLTSGAVGWTAAVGILPGAPAVDANGYIYVPGIGSDEITVVSPAGVVVAQIAFPAGSGPYSIVITADAGFVALSELSAVAVFDLYDAGIQEPEPTPPPPPATAGGGGVGRELASSGGTAPDRMLIAAAFAAVGAGVFMVARRRRDARR